MILDAHTHITKEQVDQGILEVLKEFNIVSIACGTDPESCKFVRNLELTHNHIVGSYGLHPWNAADYQVEELRPYLESCKIMGEIGMDSTWCDVPLDKQRSVFLEQLDIAEKRGCPVILHTKGQEEEIAEIIQGYSMPIVVHWYSCLDHLDRYIARNCRFTVGPDVENNEAVQNLANQVDHNMLLVETDGLSALEWVLGRDVSFSDIPEVLSKSLEYIKNVKIT